MEEVRSTNRARALGMETLAGRVIELLASEGIKSLPLKGPFLACRAHGDGSMRVVNDFDLLVLPEQLDRSVSLIAEHLGYVSDDPGWLEGRPDLHCVLRHPDRRLPRIEVHWRIDLYEEKFSRDLLERSSPGEDGLPCARLDDELASLLLFYARDAFFGLRLAADVAGWWDRHGGDERKPVLKDHWTAYPKLRPALKAAALTAQRVVGTPAAEIIPETEPVETRVCLASRLGNWRQLGERDQLASNLSLVDGLLCPNDSLGAFLRRHMLMSKKRIAYTYRLRPDARLRVGIWEILHPPKVLVRYLLGLLSALRPER